MYKRIIPLVIFLSFINAQIALPTFQGVHKPQTAEASSLYDFTSQTFTNCGATGRNGPTLSNCTGDANYTDSWTDNTSYFNVPSDAGIQNWTVPQNGTYTIEVWGAQGGEDSEGFGARMKGDFNFSSGAVLKILIGQRGQRHRYAMSGGGGTFIATSDNTPLIVAGGGGGTGWMGSTRRETTDGDTLEAGRHGYYNNNSLNNGGTDGGGGTTSFAGSHGGGAGAGFTGNGDASNDSRGGTPVEPKSFINGGVGGYTPSNYFDDAEYGGFGGGAAGGWGGAAGGGGYSGGGSDYNTGWSGGGGSYNSGTNQSNSVGANSGDGKAVITIN